MPAFLHCPRVVRDYAIKSIVIVDFIDIADISKRGSASAKAATSPNAVIFQSFTDYPQGIRRAQMRTTLQFRGKFLRSASQFPGQQLLLPGAPVFVAWFLGQVVAEGRVNHGVQPVRLSARTCPYVAV